MHAGIFRDRNGRLVHVEPTATGYLLRYGESHIITVSADQLAFPSAEPTLARHPSTQH